MGKACKTMVLTLLLAVLLGVSAQAMENDMLKVGIKYGSDAMSSANLQNYSDFGGYAFGYYDSSREFTQLGYVGSECEKITVTTDTTYAVELNNEYASFDEARTAAVGCGGYPAYVMGSYRVRIGTYATPGEAEDARYSYDAASCVVGASSTGVKVFITGLYCLNTSFSNCLRYCSFSFLVSKVSRYS